VDHHTPTDHDNARRSVGYFSLRQIHTSAVAASRVELIAGSARALEISHVVFAIAVDAQVIEHVTLVNVCTKQCVHCE